MEVKNLQPDTAPSTEEDQSDHLSNENKHLENEKADMTEEDKKSTNSADLNTETPSTQTEPSVDKQSQQTEESPVTEEHALNTEPTVAGDADPAQENTQHENGKKSSQPAEEPQIEDGGNSSASDDVSSDTPPKKHSSSTTNAGSQASLQSGKEFPLSKMQVDKRTGQSQNSLVEKEELVKPNTDSDQVTTTSAEESQVSQTTTVA